VTEQNTDVGLRLFAMQTITLHRNFFRHTDADHMRRVNLALLQPLREVFRAREQRDHLRVLPALR
jgi:hypothetical protein